MNLTPEQRQQALELIDGLKDFNSKLRQLNITNGTTEETPIDDGHGQNSTDTTKTV